MIFNVHLRKLVLGIIGIYVVFICLSYYTQKIYNHPYRFFRNGRNGHAKEHYFKYPSLIAWTGCLLCTFYGILFAKLNKQRQNPISLVARIKLGLIFCLNILPSNFALLYISYPLQVIAKASRYFFLILFGVLSSKRQQIKGLIIPKSKIIIAVVILFSTCVFIYEQFVNKQPANHFKSSKKWIGISFLAVAIVSDAFFVDQQTIIRNTFSPTANHLFWSYNFTAFLILFVSAVVSGTLFSSLKFCYYHPSIIWDIVCVGILQLINQQIAINLIIINFKPYIYPLISSTRRIIILIASIVIFQHSLSLVQTISVFFICFGVLAQLAQQIQSKNEKKKQDLSQITNSESSTLQIFTSFK